MGKKPRTKPRRLGKKLRQIRENLGLSQNEMLRRAGLDKKYGRNNLSNYELDKREPPYPILLGYSQVSGIPINVILDDKVALPQEFLKNPAGKTKKTSKKRQRS
jgi:transcriptional regulator with XRE-family HTH domain